MARPSETIFRKLRAWHLYLLLGLLATGGYFFLPSIAAHNILTDLIGVSAVVMIIAGISLHHPGRPLPWYLFALGLLMFVIGDTIWSYYEVVLQVESPFPSVADMFYLAGYPFIIAGLLLIQQRELGRSRANLIDPMIVATGIGLLSWVFLMGPHAENSAVPLLERLVSIAYPLADVLLLAAIVRLLFLSAKRSPAYYLFGASLVLMLVADTGFAALELGDAYETGNPIDAGFLLLYVTMGAAALHPSMATLSEPTPRIEPQLTTLRLALLAGASLMAPGVLVIQAVRGEPIDVPVIAGGGGGADPAGAGSHGRHDARSRASREPREDPEGLWLRARVGYRPARRLPGCLGRDLEPGEGRDEDPGELRGRSTRRHGRGSLGRRPHSRSRRHPVRCPRPPSTPTLGSARRSTR